MFQKYIGYCIVCVLLFYTKQVNAQYDSTRNHLMIVPHYLVFDGMRIDYELKIKNNHWIQLCPQFYFKENNSSSDDNISPISITNNNTNTSLRRLFGVGLDAYHKIYLGISYRQPGAFISYGASANYFEIEYADEGNVSQTSTSSFSKIGGDVIIGYDLGFKKNLIIFGIYTGLGYRYSFTNNSQIKKNFTRSMYDYAYSGNIFLIGFRFGTKF